MSSFEKSKLITGILAGSLEEAGFSNPFLNGDPLEGINIKEEYNRIKNKKSELSANMRRMVAHRYEKNERKKS